MRKPRKDEVPDKSTVTVRIRRWVDTIVTVHTYKGFVVMYVPGMDKPLWLTAEDADNLAAALRKVATARRRLDAYGKKKGIRWID